MMEMEEKQKAPNGRPYDLEERTFLFAKEIRTYWLRLLNCGNSAVRQTKRDSLTIEARELMNIFGAILRKSG